MCVDAKLIDKRRNQKFKSVEKWVNMFNFMKKESDRDEKERRKREKKLRKEAKDGAARSSMSAEELLRLDEVRRSLKIRGRKKDKEKLPSGITADYSSFFANLDENRELDRGTEEILATANTTTYIDSNGDLIEKIHLTATTVHSTAGSSGTNVSDTSSETSNHSASHTKVGRLMLMFSFIFFCAPLVCYFYLFFTFSVNRVLCCASAGGTAACAFHCSIVQYVWFAVFCVLIASILVRSFRILHFLYNNTTTTTNGNGNEQANK